MSFSDYASGNGVEYKSVVAEQGFDIARPTHLVHRQTVQPGRINQRYVIA